jgi:CubicO group peptidase (beta-lactamase class C family)
MNNRSADLTASQRTRARARHHVVGVGALIGALVLAACGVDSSVTSGPRQPLITQQPRLPLPGQPLPTVAAVPASSEVPIDAPVTTLAVEPAPAPVEDPTATLPVAPVEPGAAEQSPVDGEQSAAPPVVAAEAPAFYPVPAVVPDASAGKFAAFDQLIGQETIGKGALTLSISIAYQGQIVHEAAYGLEDVRTGVTPTPASRFRIASISKVFTATVVMQLVEQGLVSLDETFLPSLGVAFGDSRTANITVRQLLSHTSGIPSSEPVFFNRQVSTWQEASGVVLGLPLETDPGTKYRYSNANFTLLGSLIEQRTGVPYEQAVRSYLLTPLGLTSMRLAGTFDTQIGDVFHPSTAGRNYMESLGSSGQWIASSTDVLKLLLALDANVPLSQTFKNEMRTPAPTFEPGTNLDWRYGLGLRLRSDGSWGHSGTLEQAKAMALVRSDGWAVCILVNGEVPDRTDTLATLIDMGFASITP